MKTRHNFLEALRTFANRTTLSLVKAKPQIFGAGPVLPVHNVQAAVDYYCSKLGFDYDFVSGDPPSHGSVTRCRVGIQFTLAPAGFESSNYPGYTYFFVNDVDKLHTEYTAKQVEISRVLESHDFGMREFEIVDCNAFRLRFGQYL